MSKGRLNPELPACYAMVQRGLEEVAGDEITRDLGGEVKKRSQGLVAFRLPTIDTDILKLRTVEDVFLLAWGTDSLTYRAADLDKIRQWTRKVPWEQLLRHHHAVHPKPKGKPTYWLATQMIGEHGHRRIDARKALAEGMAGVVPASWKPAEENAAVRVRRSVNDDRAACA